MSFWKNILRILGLSSEARVHISAPGIEVVLTGDPEQVRALLSVVKTELERNARAQYGGRRRLPSNEDQIVHPTELDEMDSPYALPDAKIMPVGDSQVTDEKIVRVRNEAEDLIDDAPTMLPDPDTHEEVLNQRPRVATQDSDDRPKPEVVGTKLESDPPPDEESEVEPEVTAVAQNPSGPTPAPPSKPPLEAPPAPKSQLPDFATVEVHSPPKGTRSPDLHKSETNKDQRLRRSSSPGFVTDGGPTLMPSDSQSDMHRMDSQDDPKDSDSDVSNV